ncbi:putative secreted protein (Por secretion system target) [Jejuia pallidilutea]|uniref:Putative secreted protein (Por secretion system target) n=1 Tax=Jejuia pallidilutea TaxID=504487 RepID=A0A362X7E0_9FLAO|nr:carbohydrate-binding protein [Jejuia pallidilutea]PQV49012.1 putative secreted protein (Por secretion system target) [Jejuia pallidilutea]
MNHQKKGFYVFFIFLILPITSVIAQLVHPGISHSMSDLERIKAMVETGEEPWASEFANFSSNSKSLCSYTVKGNTSITEITNHGDFQNDGYAAYYNALMWYITGNECHAEKAVEIFNSWVNVTNTTGIPLNQGRGPWKMCEGAEIIKYTYNGWSLADQQKFADMLVYPGYSTTSVPSGNKTFYWNLYQGDPGRYGNQGLFAYRSLMAMAIFLDNEIMYDRALRYLQGLPHRADDLAYPSGPPNFNTNTPYNNCEFIEERNASGRRTTIEDYGYNEVMSNYIYENGQCQESARDQVHSSVGIQIIACMAEIAWNQGDNLYGHLDNRLLKGIEFFFRYNVGADQFSDYGHPDWNPTVASGEFIERRDRTGRFLAKKINPHVVCDYTRDSRGEDVLDPWYEMVLGHYKDRINLPSTNYEWTLKGLEIYQDVIGFEGEHRPSEFHGWGGLKFHRVSPGDPISGFDGNGLPTYSINDLSVPVEAENYDYFVLDGQGRTYNDTSVSNDGGEYRVDEGVDLKICSEGGYCVTNIEDGEWLTYTVNVPSNGIYNISIRYASVNSNGKIKFNFGGEDITSEVAVPFGTPNSTGLTDWKDLEVANEVRLVQGVQAMKVLFSGVNNTFELNNITVTLVEADPDPINLAIAHGVATQSTNRPSDGFAPNAIDGNTNGLWSGGSVTHTGGNATLDPEPWWQVDLGNNYNIETIKIYNRTDGCCAGRLNNFTVEVIDSEGNVTFSQFFATAPSNIFTVATGDVVGRVIRISKTSSTALALAEVEVYGVNSPVTLSNQDVEFKSKIKLYPNPTQNTFTIENCVGSKLAIYNLLGKQVLQTTVADNKQLVDVRFLDTGIYFVKISANGNTLTKKMVKK